MSYCILLLTYSVSIFSFWSNNLFSKECGKSFNLDELRPAHTAAIVSGPKLYSVSAINIKTNNHMINASSQINTQTGMPVLIWIWLSPHEVLNDIQIYSPLNL